MLPLELRLRARHYITSHLRAPKRHCLNFVITWTEFEVCRLF